MQNRKKKEIHYIIRWMRINWKKIKEIAEELNISIATVKYHLKWF